MTLKIKNIRSKVNVEWKWPVQIGFLKKLVGNRFQEDIDKHYYLKSLSHSFIINRIRRKTNILVLNGTFKDIVRATSGFTYLVKTDLLVIFLNKYERMPRDYNKVSKLFNNISFNSLLILRKPEGQTIYFWLDRLIVELSHNKTIDQSIKTIGWSGMLALTSKLRRESKVDKVFDNILIKINKQKSLKNYDFSEVFSDTTKKRILDLSGLTVGTSIEKPSRVITDTRKKKKRFRYDRELDESSVLRDISVAHSANVSDMFNIKDFDEEEEKDFPSLPDSLRHPDTISDDLDSKEPNSDSSSKQKRSLQCVFMDDKNHPQHHALVSEKNYNLIIKIDTPDPVFLQGGEVSRDDVRVKKGKPEDVYILLRYDDTIERQKIKLPSKGSSTIANFSINRKPTGECIFEIFAFHKNRLFQNIAASVFFCENSEAFGETPFMKIVMINMPRTILSDFELKEDYGLSLVFTDGYPVIAEKASIREIRNEVHINSFNDELRKIIEAYVVSSDPNVDDLILNLAMLGKLFYTNIFNGKGDFDKPIQIISDSTTYFPIEFIYTKNLTEQTEKLCPNASNALNKGVCSGCNDDELKHICPFGFLSLSTIIERHQVGENVDQLKKRDIGIKNDVSLNRKAIPFLDKTVYGTSEKVEKVIQGLRKRVGDTLSNFSNESQEAKSWAQWKDAIKNDPDSLVIVGHVEPNGNIMEKIEVGGDFKQKAFIDESFLRSKNSGSTPILVLIGCSTQNVKMSFLDFAQHFKSLGAAIVISTFTKIRGSHAGPLVEKLFEVLHNYKGKEIRFGEAMLKLRQLLFAEGIYVSMAMVSHGDADWKLKI